MNPYLRRGVLHEPRVPVAQRERVAGQAPAEEVLRVPLAQVDVRRQVVRPLVVREELGRRVAEQHPRDVVRGVSPRQPVEERVRVLDNVGDRLEGTFQRGKHVVPVATVEPRWTRLQRIYSLPQQQQQQEKETHPELCPSCSFRRGDPFLRHYSIDQSVLLCVYSHSTRTPAELQIGGGTLSNVLIWGVLSKNVTIRVFAKSFKSDFDVFFHRKKITSN